MASSSNTPSDNLIKDMKPEIKTAKRWRRPAPPQLEIRFVIPESFRCKLSRQWIVRTMVRAMLVHVLYTRGVVPTPVQDILRYYDCEKENKRREASIKCGASLCGLLQQWDDLPHHKIDAILISLGPSWSRPREKYLLQANGLGLDISLDDTPGPTIKQEHTLSRRLITTFMNGTNGSNNKETADFMARPALGASSYQVQISILVTKSVAEEMFEAQKMDHPLIVRHGFQPEVQRMHEHRQSSRESAAMITTCVSISKRNESVANHLAVEHGVWLTLPTVVKGYHLRQAHV